MNGHGESFQKRRTDGQTDRRTDRRTLPFLKLLSSSQLKMIFHFGSTLFPKIGNLGPLCARGLLPSDRGEQRRDGGQFQLNLGDPSASYFAKIFYHGNKHGCVNISVNVS